MAINSIFETSGPCPLGRGKVTRTSKSAKPKSNVFKVRFRAKKGFRNAALETLAGRDLLSLFGDDL
jgi:hypothetical protein